MSTAEIERHRDQFLRRDVRHARGPSGHAQAEVGPDHQHQFRRRSVGLKHTGAYSAAKFAVEGMSLAVAHEVEQFGIKIVVVAPGFFRTDLLDARNAKYSASAIEDYAAEGKAEDMWSAYDGKQQGDPASSATSL